MRNRSKFAGGPFVFVAPARAAVPRLAVFAPRATCAFDAVARITPCIARASFEVSFEFSRARFLRSRVDRASVDG
jgi:hypothetical protein